MGDLHSSSSQFNRSDSQIRTMLNLALDAEEDGIEGMFRADAALGGLFDQIMTARGVEDLQSAKIAAKRMAETGSARAATAARVLYHLAIAVAINRFQAKISRTPREKRQVVYSEFAAEFKGHPVGREFRDALASRM